MSVIVVAHDEADRIAARIDNLLALDYPRDRLEILIASDGSTDGTASLARAYAQDGVAVHAFAARRGKAAVLNDVVPKARGAIVVLADARQRFEPETVRALTRPFADPVVGAVSGELILTEAPGGATVGRGVGVYWRYEKLIRKSESRVDSTVGATGAVYAIRRELFEPIPEDTLLDDVLIPLHIVRRGYRVLFEPAARAWDRVAAARRRSSRARFARSPGNFQLFWRAPWLLDPRRNRIWLATVSHKGLRLLGPVLHAGAFVASAGAGGCLRLSAALVAQAASTGWRWVVMPRGTHVAARAPVRSLRRLPPQLGDRRGILPLLHGAPARDVGARVGRRAPCHHGMAWSCRHTRSVGSTPLPPVIVPPSGDSSLALRVFASLTLSPLAPRMECKAVRTMVQFNEGRGRGVAAGARPKGVRTCTHSHSMARWRSLGPC